MKNHFRNIILILFIVVIANITLIKAQSSDTTLLPSLDKHIFTSITGVDDPFIKTKFSLNIGYAYLFNTDITINLPEVAETVSFQPDLFYFVGGMKYQHAVKDWVAISLQVEGAARVGDNVVSIATQGISAVTLFGIGMMFKFAENNDLSFSGAIDLNTSAFTYISLEGKFEDIISGESGEQIFQKYQMLTGSTELRFAYRFSSVLGLMANGSGSIGEIYAEDSEREFNWSFGTLLSLDLQNWIHIPFGIGFGGTILSNNWQFSETDKPVYSINLNISFINQDDLTIGLENYIQMFEQDRFNETYYFHYTKIALNYYF